MKTRPFFIIALLAALPGTAAKAAPEVPQLCHIANAGFALRAPEGTVLIDALFRSGLPDYPRASDELNERLETGTVPFDDVRFVVVSHAHDDHFDPEALVRHARHNAGARYIVTPQARERMIAAGLPDAAANRVHAIYPATNETRRMAHHGIAVTVYRVSHGEGHPTQNIGTLIEAGGVTVFHTGDMEPDADELAEAGLEKLKVEVALVPFWVLMSEESRELMRATFAADWFVPMHLPAEEQDWMAEYGGLAGLRRQIEDRVQNAIWMTREMGCGTMSNTDSD
ncbi:MAG: MBL fold metallo-hydrolase [Alphaproteobacteria bacterium]